MLLLAFISLVFFEAQAQTGPGGVGSSSDLRLWARGDADVFSDNGTTNSTNGGIVTQWNDQSGNSNELTQSLAAKKPTYNTGQINGLPSITFDNTSEFLSTGNTGANLTELTTIVVGRFAQASQGTNDYDYMVNIGDDRLDAVSISRFRGATSNANRFYNFVESSVRFGPTLNNSFHIYDLTVTTSSPFHALHIDGTSQTLAAHNAAINISSEIRVGGMTYTNSATNPLDGDVAEIVVVENSINSTQRIIIENYLGAKYALTIATDKYSGQATHPNEVAGIGQEGTGNNHTDAQGSAMVRISGADDLDDGEYLMWGHDGATVTSTTSELPASFSGSGAKLNREWFSDETGGDLGTVDITFDMSALSLGADPAGYRILTDTDGNFANSNDNAAITPVAVGNLITFNNVDLSSEPYFTIAHTLDVDECVSFASLDWNDPTPANIWDCLVTPDSTKNVTIDDGTGVSLVGNASCNDLTVNPTGALAVGPGATLIVNGAMTINGLLTFGAGSTLILRGQFGTSQGLRNLSGTAITLANVEINNPDDISLTFGDWEISEGLSLIDGDLDVAAGDLKFASTLASHGHVSNITANGGLTTSGGTLTAERFMSGRTADWNDLGTVGINTTVSDIDNEIFISGVVGADGYASGSGGGGFISMYTFNNTTDAYVPVGNVTDAMNAGIGFETWLGDNLTNWNAKAWDFTGTSINLATTNLPVNSGGGGWNLLANPFPAFIDFSIVEANHSAIVGNEFWYYDADSTQYNSRGPNAMIPPGQGFWVNISGATTQISIDPTTDILSTTSTSNFFKNDQAKEELKVSLRNKDIPFGSAAYLRKSDYAFEGKDEGDIPPLRVPDSRACNIAWDFGYEEAMVNHVSTHVDYLELPLKIDSKIEGEFELEVNGFNKFNEFDCVKIVDNETGESFDLFSGSVLALSIGQDLRPLEMTLILSKEDSPSCQSTAVGLEDDLISVHSQNQSVFVDFYLDRSATANIDVFDVLGNKVYESSKNVGFSRESIQLSHVTTGVYFVTVKVNDISTTEKIFIK